MDALRQMTRRNVVRGIAAAAVTSALPWSLDIAQASARIIVIGGGFGGAACARALRKIRRQMAGDTDRTKSDFRRLPLQQTR